MPQGSMRKNFFSSQTRSLFTCIYLYSIGRGQLALEIFFASQQFFFLKPVIFLLASWRPWFFLLGFMLFYSQLATPSSPCRALPLKFCFIKKYMPFVHVKMAGSTNSVLSSYPLLYSPFRDFHLVADNTELPRSIFVFFFFSQNEIYLSFRCSPPPFLQPTIPYFAE